MTDTREIPKVSMTNTKKELLVAYASLKKRYQDHAKDLLDAKKARKKMEQKLSLSEAETQSTQDPVQRLRQLRNDIGGALLDLADKFESELDAFKKVQSAVKTRQEELQTIYGVETAASDLAALIEAQQTRKTAFQEEMEKQKTDFEHEMEAARKAWNIEAEKREQLQKETAEKIEKERQREKEEYEYHFAREKKQLQNSLDDEHKIFEKTCQERTDELNAREQALEERQKEFTALQEQVATFPQRLKDEIDAAVQNTRERLNADFEKSTALLAAKHDGEKNVLLSKLESYEQRVDAYQTQLADLSKRQEQAYEKVQDIANQAVGAAKRDISAPVVVRRDTPDS